MPLIDLIKYIHFDEHNKEMYRGGDPLVIAKIRTFIASCGGKEWMHEMMDTKLHAAVFIGCCAEFMVNGEPNEIMTKACELIDKQFPNQPDSFKTLIENGIIHFTEDDAEFRKMIFESDLYLAFLDVIGENNYLEELSFYWSDASYALYSQFGVNLLQ
jgi:hypothetical protein